MFLDSLTSSLGVSIRTRHRCRVMPVIATHKALTEKFQSAPGIAAG